MRKLHLLLLVTAAGILAGTACKKESSLNQEVMSYRDSLGHDTLPGDTLPGDTIPGDTIPGDTIPHDTLPHDTFPHDTIPHDTIPRDSTIFHTQGRLRAAVIRPADKDRHRMVYAGRVVDKLLRWQA